MRPTIVIPAPDATTSVRRRAGRLSMLALTVTTAGALVVAIVSVAFAGPASRWSAKQRETLRSMTLSTLEPLAPDKSNRFADNPRAAAFGQQLFFEKRLSGNGKVSCGTCHAPAYDFQDSKPLAEGVGTTARRTMPIAGTAYSPWLFWDGRADSQWAQALGPLESAVEHGGNRTQYAQLLADQYRAEYEELFGKLPNMKGLPENAGPVADAKWRAAWQQMPATRQEDVSRVYANIGKAIAAYERQIRFTPSRFDRFVATELAGEPHSSASAFSADEVAGLQLFMGKANCINCHNGALLSDGHFHNTGVPASPAVSAPDSGRSVGVRQALVGEFNCTSRYSDAKADDCDELRFAVADGPELVRAYKAPSLRNVAERAPYMHAGQISTLAGVVAHYNSAPRAPFGRSELKPLHLSTTEQRQLVAFLQTLSSPLSAPGVAPSSSLSRR